MKFASVKSALPVQKLQKSLMLPLLIGALSMGAFGLSAISAISPAMAQEAQMLRTLTVTGMGKESIPTTIAEVQLGVVAQGKTAAEVQQAAAKQSTAVVAYLRSHNVSKLQTTGIYLSPNYDYNNGQQRLTGYTATNTVSFRVNSDQAGTVMDEAVKAGATQINGISLVAEDAAIATAQKQAIGEATKDAQAQADAAFSALNLKGGAIVSVQVNGATPPSPIPQPYETRALAARAADAPSTPVVSGEQEVQASVTLQIQY